MKLDDFKIAAARPQSIRPNARFTEAVMQKIIHGQPKQSARSRLLLMLRKSPALAVLAIILSIAFATGVVYAVRYLWPHSNVSVTDVNQRDGHTTLTVFTDNCGEQLTKRYRLKPGATISLEQAPKVVAAECNLNAIAEWTTKTYPDIAKANGEIGAQLPNKPGNIVRDVLMPSSPYAVSVEAISEKSITVKYAASDDSTATYPITPETRFVVNHEYADWSKVHAGDAVAIFVSTKQTMKADLSCTKQNCHYSIAESQSSLLAVATLDQAIEFYRSGLSGQVYELTPCDGNPADDCGWGGAGIDLYTSTATEDNSVPHGTNTTGNVPDGYTSASLQGKLVSWNASQVVIKTSSGREVTIHTSVDIISSFNTHRAREYNYTIAAGDTIAVNYSHPQNATNDTEVSANTVWSIMLQLSTLNKGDTNFQRL